MPVPLPPVDVVVLDPAVDPLVVNDPVEVPVAVAVFFVDFEPCSVDLAVVVVAVFADFGPWSVEWPFVVVMVGREPWVSCETCVGREVFVACDVVCVGGDVLVVVCVEACGAVGLDAETGVTVNATSAPTLPNRCRRRMGTSGR